MHSACIATNQHHVLGRFALEEAKCYGKTAGMNVEIFTIAEGAELNDGVLQIRGARTRCATTFPAIVPNTVVVARIRFSLDEEGRHEITLATSHNDGDFNEQAPAIVNVRAEGNDIYAWHNLAFSWQNTTISGPNDYVFTLLVDGATLATAHLNFVRA